MVVSFPGFLLKSKSLLKLTGLSQDLILGSSQIHSPKFIITRYFQPYSKKTMTRKNQNNNKGQKRPAKSKEDNASAPKIPKKKIKPELLRAPSTVNIVVLGTGGPGTSHSLLVTTEHRRYMFNCGEGTQRLVVMSEELRASAHAKLSNMSNIFITHKSWENTGGLLGLSMTLEGHLNPTSKSYAQRDLEEPQPESSEENPSITIHGPQGAENSALMAKKFAVSANLKIIKAKSDYSDECLSVTSVPFYKSSNSTGGGSTSADSTEPEAKRQMLDKAGIPQTSVAYAYIVQPKSVLGKINVEKCLDAGITIGPMVGELQKGNSVTLANGTVVRPGQVMDDIHNEKRPFLVVECPSLGFLPSLTECSDITSRMGQCGEGEEFVLVAHMAPAEVYSSEPYQAWMQRFSTSTNHLVINRHAGEADLVRVRVHQAMLNLVSRDMFPVLPDAAQTASAGDTNLAAGGGANSTADGCGSKKGGQTVFASPGVLYAYRGKTLGFQWLTDPFDLKETQKECLAIPGLPLQLDTLAKVQENTQRQRRKSQGGKENNMGTQLTGDNVPLANGGKDSDLEDGGNHYPKVTFLGTGSSEPNKIRAQSCIVVQLSKHTVIILDCGEDSYGQLHRFFGKEKAKRVLCKVKAIFISHHHADHHLGLFSLLKEREKAFTSRGADFTPVLLMAPIQMKRWLRFYHEELGNVTHLFKFVKHQYDMKDFAGDIQFSNAVFSDVMKELNLEEYKPVEVMHCANSFGAVLKHRNGFKLVYSGDTRPCDALVKEGTGCDLLIHEATHEDALIAHAKASKHSTFSEAMDVGARMGAKHIILTHFSQRYPHMVPFFDMTLPSNVGIAFDNMQVSPSTLPRMASLIPALTTLFFNKMQRFEIKRVKLFREQAEREAREEEEEEGDEAKENG